MSKAVISVSYVDLNRGVESKIWWTSELVKNLEISLATFKRDREILVCEVPEFQYFRYAKTYTDYQRHCLQIIRDWRQSGLERLQIIHKLRTEGIPKYE